MLAQLIQGPPPTTPGASAAGDVADGMMAQLMDSACDKAIAAFGIESRKAQAPCSEDDRQAASAALAKASAKDATPADWTAACKAPCIQPLISVAKNTVSKSCDLTGSSNILFRVLITKCPEVAPPPFAVANEPVDLIEIIEKDAAVEPTDQVFDAKETVHIQLGTSPPANAGTWAAFRLDLVTGLHIDVGLLALDFIRPCWGCADGANAVELQFTAKGPQAGTLRKRLKEYLEEHPNVQRKWQVTLL